MQTCIKWKMAWWRLPRIWNCIFPTWEVDETVILWDNGRNISDFITIRSPASLAVYQCRKESNKKHQMIKSISLSNALMRTCSKWKPVSFINLMLSTRWRKPLWVKSMSIFKALKWWFKHRRKDYWPFGNCILLCYGKINSSDVRHKCCRRAESDNFFYYHFCVFHLSNLFWRNGRIKIGPDSSLFFSDFL